MINPVFDDVVVPNSLLQFDGGVVESFSERSSFRAAIINPNGITADDFMEYSGALAALCLQTYGSDADIEMKSDRLLPPWTTDGPETEAWLRDNPGERLHVPANPVLFTELFASVDAMEVVIKPVREIEDMPSTFAMANWSRVLSGDPRMLHLYAQAGNSKAGREFIQRLYGTIQTNERSNLRIAYTLRPPAAELLGLSRGRHESGRHVSPPEQAQGRLNRIFDGSPWRFFRRSW